MAEIVALSTTEEVQRLQRPTARDPLHNLQPLISDQARVHVNKIVVVEDSDEEDAGVHSLQHAIPHMRIRDT